MNPVIKVGHRGAMGYEPQNTLRSFAKALELGVDMVELDVYVCKSGEVVVIHNEQTSKTTSGKGNVSELTLTELKEFDAGKGEKIPTLKEVLDLIDAKIDINIELKGERTAEPAAKILEEYIKNTSWTSENFLVSSFNHHNVKEFAEHAPDIKRAVVQESIPIGYAEFAEETGSSAVVLSHETVTQAYVDDAHKRGLQVFTYTVNEPEDIALMKALGVDGIISNYPDRV